MTGYIRNLQIVNVALTTATDEYSIVIPTGASNVQMKLGDATHTAQIYQVSVGNGGTPANAWLLNAGEIYALGVTMQQEETLYAMPATNSTVLQVSY
jgi:hypothetical protein